MQPPALINERDFDGLYRAIQRKFSFVERRRPLFLLGIIGSAVTFLRYSYKVLVHFPVAVLIVKHRDGERALRQVLENDLAADRLGINLYSLLPESLRRVVRETPRVLKESNPDLSFVCAGDDHGCHSRIATRAESLANHLTPRVVLFI